MSEEKKLNVQPIDPTLFQMLTLVSVYDKVSKKFGSIVCIDNDLAAVRAFRDMVHNKDTVIGQHPSDFVLYKVGFFNFFTGEIYQKFSMEEDILCTGFEAEAME